MKHAALFVATSLLPALAACASTSSSEPAPPEPPEITARIELSSQLVPNTAERAPDLLVLNDDDLRGRGGRVVPDQAAELLPAFLQEVETRLTARWTGEAQLVSQIGEGVVHQDRLLTARRILSFPATETAARHFAPGTPTPNGEVVVSELTFALQRSEYGQALRVRLERVFVRAAEVAIPRLVPLKKGRVPIVFSLTLRYIEDGAEVSRTVLFQETVDLRAGDHEGGGQISDWIPVPAGPRPHSVQLAIISREELDKFAKTLRSAGLSIFSLVGKVKKAVPL
jgi:hypothetical protein